MPPVPVARYLAANIRARRIRLDLTQEQLAECIGLGVKHMQKIEAGKVDVTISMVAKLASVLRTVPDQLLLPATLPPPRHGRPKKTKKSQ